MSKIAFTLYYVGFAGLMAAYTVKEVWLDRISLILLLMGCWAHASLWKQYIESINAPASSLVAALELLNKRRSEMDMLTRLLPNLFSGRILAEKNEYRFIRLSNKSLSQAMRSHFNNPWEAIPIALCGAIPLWIFGISAFHYERYYRMSPLLHDFMTHLSIIVVIYFLSIGITNFFIFHLLRK